MNLLKRQHKLKQQQQSWKKEKKLLEQEFQLKQDKQTFLNHNKISKVKKRISTSKKIIMFLFINCSLVELFTGYITIVDLKIAAETGSMVDFTPIVTLIGAVVGEIIGFAIYAIKATKQNTAGGLVYQSMMNEFDSSHEENKNEIVG